MGDAIDTLQYFTNAPNDLELYVYIYNPALQWAELTEHGTLPVERMGEEVRQTERHTHVSRKNKKGLRNRLEIFYIKRIHSSL